MTKTTIEGSQTNGLIIGILYKFIAAPIRYPILNPNHIWAKSKLSVPITTERTANVINTGNDCLKLSLALDILDESSVIPEISPPTTVQFTNGTLCSEKLIVKNRWSI